MLREVYIDLEKDLAGVFENKTSGDSEPVLSFEDLEGFVVAYSRPNILGPSSSILNHPEFGEFPFLLHFSASYNSFLYSKMTTVLKGDAIYPYDIYPSDRKKEFDLVVLQLWGQRRNLLNVLGATFLSGYEFQAVQLLRPFIEVTQLIFLLLTDRERLVQFMASGLSEDEYNKLWWSKLAPRKITSGIKRNRDAISLEYKRKGYSVPFDVRLAEPGGNQEFFETLLHTASNYLHWKKNALFEHSFDNKISAFRLNADNDWSAGANQWLVSIIEVVTHSTAWIEDALETHIRLFAEDNDSVRCNQLALIHSIFATRCSYRGLYEFAKTEFFPNGHQR